MSKASMPELLRLFAAKAEEWCNATDIGAMVAYHEILSERIKAFRGEQQ
ncbi:hypothetical protein [Ralstonia phage RPZH3]|nr:hypothetical protein [Ralstonia phage RPZH3]